MEDQIIWINYSVSLSITMLVLLLWLSWKLIYDEMISKYANQ